MMYRIAKASEILVITGFGIEDIKIAKKSWIYPGQSCTKCDISPVNYTFQVQAMSAEKLPFILPTVFTIGPRVDDIDSLLKYAKLISPHDKHSNHVNELVQGVIEGETCALAASMTMEQVFKGTKEFKKEVFDKVQLELNQFGLLIYNANVKQLVDVRGSEYFSFLGQKTQKEAENQAIIDVSEAKMKGEIGAKERQGKTLQNAAEIDAQTKIITNQRIGEGKKQEVKVNTEVKIYENQREAEVAEANALLAKKKAGWAKESKMAEVEAAKAVALRDAELQTAVEEMNAKTRTEKLKAELLTKASVEYDTRVKQADWEFYPKQKLAEAFLYEKKKQAEAEQASASAALFSTASSLNNGSETLDIDGSQLSPSVNSRTARTAGSSSNGSVTLDIHGALNLEPGDGSQLSPSVNSWTAGSSSNGSVTLDIHGALNLEPGDGSQLSPSVNSWTAGSSSNGSVILDVHGAFNLEPSDGSPGQMDRVPELPGNDDQARYELDLESQMYIRQPSFPAGQTDAGPVSVEQSVPESPGNDDHNLFGFKTRWVLATLNARALSELRSSGSSDAIPMNRLVLAALYGIGCFSSAAALLLQRRRPRHAKVLTQVSAVSTGCGILIALSTQFDSEQYSFVNTLVTALLCFMWAVAVIVAGL